MRALTTRTCAAAILAIATAYTATAEFRPTVLGHTPGSQPGTLLRIDGIPGAAQFHILDISGFASLRVSTGLNYALGIRSADGAVMLVRLSDTSPDAQPLSAGAEADLVALSPDGRSAAVYSRSKASIHVMTSLPDHPVWRNTYSTAALDNRIHALAISDDASVVLASGGTDDSHLLVATEIQTDSVSFSNPISAVTFCPGRNEAAVIAGREAFIWTGRTSGLQSVAGPGEGLAAPAGAEFSGDGRRLYIADPGAGGVHVVSRDRLSSTTVSCGCSPTELQRLQGQAVFALGDASGSRVRIIDHDAATAPRILLVPPAAQGIEQ